MNNRNISDKYKELCRPELGYILQVLRLDKVYHKAEGNNMFYRDENGNEHQVLDFLGGYGAGLFGHNHPALVNALKSSLDNKVPFNSQASCRSGAALVAEKLNQFMFSRNYTNYVTTFASTGAEIVEAAIKHAEFSHFKRINNIHKNIAKNVVEIKEKLKKGFVTLEKDFFFNANEIFKISHSPNFNEVVLALQNHNHRIFRKTPYFLSLKKSFHGKTSGAVQFTYSDKYRSPFVRLGMKVTFVEPGDTASLDKALEKSNLTFYQLAVNEKNEICIKSNKHPNITAFFVEPLQGEGGIHPVSQDYLEYCRKTCTENNIHLIFDEIQCGMGRTGTFTYSEQLGVIPDYYLFSKSLGGGLTKISAMMVNEEMYEDEFSMLHSSTFAEDELSSSVALAALKLLEDSCIMDNCAEKGEFIKKGFEEIKAEFPEIIKEVRGTGLMLGVELLNQKDHGSTAVYMLGELDLLGYVTAGYLLHEHKIRVAPTLSSDVTIRLEPSAFITIEDCQKLFTAFRRLCEALQKQNIYELTKFIIGLETTGNMSEIHNFRKEKAPYKTPENARKVAFIGHFIDAGDMVIWDKGFSLLTREQMDQYLSKIYPLLEVMVYDQVTVKSETGELVSLNFMGFCVDSKTISESINNKDVSLLHEKIEKAVAFAADYGCSAMGFGGYTSIITNNCQNLLSDSMALTTGNSLTVGMGLEAIMKAAEDMKIDIATACFAAIGASGNICSIYSRIMAESVPRLILIARPGREKMLDSLAAEIYADAFGEIMVHAGKIPGTKKELKGVALAISRTETVKKLLEEQKVFENYGNILLEKLNLELGKEAPLLITSDFNRLKEANLILGGSNAPGAVIYPEMLKEGSVVICDISVPMDTHPSVYKKPGVAVIQGGLVRLPCNPDFKIRGLPLETGTTFACMGETLLLGLTGISEDYSYGKITKVKVKNIMEIARLHGFSLARIKTEKSY